MINPGFIELVKGYWFEESTSRVWTSKRPGNNLRYDNPLKLLTSKDTWGYYRVYIDGKFKQWHRVVWEYWNGPIPEGMTVDHKDNDTTNNFISNLQLLSIKDNCRFCKPRYNKTGYPGVRKENDKFVSNIRFDGKCIRLGLFNTPQEAYKAFYEAKIKHHGPESVRALDKPV